MLFEGVEGKEGKEGIEGVDGMMERLSKLVCENLIACPACPVLSGNLIREVACGKDCGSE